MAVQTKEKYNQSKVDKLADYVRMYHDKGQPFDFEILVDGFKAVRRTSDPEMFSMFESFVNADTKSIEILFYTGSSNNNDKHIFFFGENPKESLGGIDIDSRVEEQLARKLRETAFDDLRKENTELKAEVTELEEEVEQLQKEKSAIESSQSPLKGFLGEIGSSFVESFIRRNPGIVKGIPGGEALAGLIESDNKRKEREDRLESNEETEVSFKPKSNNPSLSEEDEAAITFVNQLKRQFAKNEFDKVLLMLEHLASDKAKIDIVLNLIN